MKYLKWFAAALAFGLAYFAVKYVFEYNRDESAITGATRTAFVENAVKTCLPRQRAEAAGKDVPDSVIVEYCQCYADGMADRIKRADLQKLSNVSQTDQVKAMQPVIDAASDACIAVVEKKLPK